jgi:hypothetical protein
MKSLAVILFSLALSFLGNSQVVVIQVNEVKSFFGDPTWTLDRVLTDPYYSSAPVHKDCRYIVNFNDSTVAFYRDGEMIDEGPAQILTQDGVSIVKILEEGFDFGLIVDLRLESESVTLYQIYSDEIECMKFTDFQIIRPS